MLATALMGGAQVLTVKSIEKIDVPVSEETAAVAAFAPSGDYLLLSSPSHRGLVKFDLASKKATTLTTAEGAGYNAQIMANGANVVYREKSISHDKLTYTAVKQVDVATLNKVTLVEPTRDLQAVAVEGNTAITTTRGKMNLRAMDGKTTATRPVISSENLLLYIHNGSEQRLFAPQGTEVTYIWPSLSPDATRVLYYVGATGCFVANLDGTEVISMGQIRAPKWLNNNTIVGMRDTDNGVFVTSSVIVAKTLAGTEQVITGDDTIAMFPLTNADGTKIVFSTPAGEVYMMNVQQ